MFDDETTNDSMRSKVEQLSIDIGKATTVETRAIYLCRRGALLRKVNSTIMYMYLRMIFLPCSWGDLVMLKMT